jgi:CHAD domain-containing protein
MAKARAVAIDPEGPFGEAARRTLAVRGPELLEFRDGTLLGEDIEELHSMRVASRRLRAALEVYAGCFPRKRHQRLLALVKETADALSEARDLDVMIEFLQRYATTAPGPDRAGVQSLVQLLRRQRRAADEHLGPAIARLETEAFAEQLRRLAGDGVT